MNNKFTRLSLSLGGSTGSVGLGGGGSPLDLGCGGDGSFFASFTGAVSAFGGGVGDGWLTAFSDGAAFSEGAAFGAPSPDFEMAATLMPGSTVSPSLAKSYYQVHSNQYKQSRITDMCQWYLKGFPMQCFQNNYLCYDSSRWTNNINCHLLIQINEGDNITSVITLRSRSTLQNCTQKLHQIEYLISFNLSDGLISFNSVTGFCMLCIISMRRHSIQVHAHV